MRRDCHVCIQLSGANIIRSVREMDSLQKTRFVPDCHSKVLKKKSFHAFALMI